MLFGFIKSKGWREAANAVFAAVLLGLIIAGAFVLMGCAPLMQVNAEYEHHSSIPDYYDLNTTDQAGVCIDQKLAYKAYAPSIEGCVHFEFGGEPVFGKNPVGTLRIKQPLFIGKDR